MPEQRKDEARLRRAMSHDGSDRDLGLLRSDFLGEGDHLKKTREEVVAERI
jgi:hypothetical protein